MEVHLEHYDIPLNYAWPIRGNIPPRPTFPLVTYSQDFKLKSSTTIFRPQISPCSRIRPKAQYVIWALIPTIYIYIYI